MRRWKISRFLGFIVITVSLSIVLAFSGPISEWLAKWAFIKILDTISKLGVLIGVITFIAEIPQRSEQQAIAQKRAKYEAWQIINANEGKKSDGGRLDALQDLNQQQVSLAGIRLDHAFLSGIDLSHSMLRLASFDGAFLDEANLSNADLRGAKLTGGAFLYGTDLSNANLHGATLTDAFFDGKTVFRNTDLSFSNLGKASFWQSDLEDVNLAHADLSGAIMLDVNLTRANLNGVIWEKTVYTNKTLFPDGFNLDGRHMYLVAPGVDLSGIDLSGVNLLIAPLKNAQLCGVNLGDSILERTDLTGANISNANFRGAKCLTVSQIKSAKNWQMAFFDDEFCKELGL